MLPIVMLFLLSVTDKVTAANEKYGILEKRKRETFSRNNEAYNRNQVRQPEVSFKRLPDSQTSSMEDVEANSRIQDDQTSQHQL